MTDQIKICLDCQHYLEGPQIKKCRKSAHPTHADTCSLFEQALEPVDPEPKEDRQYWLMTPGKNNTTYVARCFSSLKNLLEYAEKQRTPLNKIFALSARNLKLRLEVEDN